MDGLQLKVDRKEFASKCGALLTKGKPGIKSSDSNQITGVLAYIKTDSITFVGAQVGGTIFGRTTLPTKAPSEAMYIISDFEWFYKLGKDSKSKELLISFEDRTILVGDENGSDGISLITNSSGFEKVIQWYEDVKFATVPILTKDAVEYKYSPWFSMEDSGPLTKFSEKVISFVVKDDCIIDTSSGEIDANCINEANIRSVIRKLPGKVHAQLQLSCEYLYPVLDNLSGPVDVFTYTTSKGQKRLYFKDAYCEWQVNMK